MLKEKNVIDALQDSLGSPIAFLVNVIWKDLTGLNVTATGNVNANPTLLVSNAMKLRMSTITFQQLGHVDAMNSEWRTIFVTRKLAIAIAWLMSQDKLAMNANLNITVSPLVWLAIAIWMVERMITVIM